MPCDETERQWNTAILIFPTDFRNIGNNKIVLRKTNTIITGTCVGRLVERCRRKKAIQIFVVMNNYLQ